MVRLTGVRWVRVRVTRAVAVPSVGREEDLYTLEAEITELQREERSGRIASAALALRYHRHGESAEAR